LGEVGEGKEELVSLEDEASREGLPDRQCDGDLVWAEVSEMGI